MFIGEYDVEYDKMNEALKNFPRGRITDIYSGLGCHYYNKETEKIESLICTRVTPLGLQCKREKDNEYFTVTSDCVKDLYWYYDNKGVVYENESFNYIIKEDENTKSSLKDRLSEVLNKISNQINQFFNRGQIIESVVKSEVEPEQKDKVEDITQFRNDVTFKQNHQKSASELIAEGQKEKQRIEMEKGLDKSVQLEMSR